MEEASYLPHYMIPKTSKVHHCVMQPAEKVHQILHGLLHLPHCHFFTRLLYTTAESFAILAPEIKISSVALLRFLLLPKIKSQNGIVLYYGQLKFWWRYFSFQASWPPLCPTTAKRLRFSNSKIWFFLKSHA